ncbi:shikimate dehydrogenase [bacterium]|nr:MAG: shikimate dehydrogenase [bacterium]
MNLADFLKSLPFRKQPFAALIGADTSYSLSPFMHNSAAEYLSIAFEYFGIDVKNNEVLKLREILNHPLCKGFNITIPYKNAILPLADKIDSKVNELQASNTFYKVDEEWIAGNTDVYGFMSPLRAVDVDFSRVQAFVFGSGGASKAVIEGLNQLGVPRIHIVSRNPEGFQLSYENWKNSIEPDSKIMLVNSSPVGMTTLKEKSPISYADLVSIKPIICYDLIYNPIETSFLKYAKEAGVDYCIDGLEMLIQQGSKAFELWNGVGFPVDEIRIICIKKLSN